MRYASWAFAWVLLATMAFTAHAEVRYRSHISMGGHAGVALSRMSFSPEVPQSWLPGPTMGVQIRYAEEKLVGILAELNFTSRGWKETFEDDPSLRYSRNLSYMTVPIMTHINFGSPRARCIINLGPEFGFMLTDNISSNFDYRNAGSLLPSTRRVNQMSMDVTGRFDYGITAGIGFEYYILPRHSIYLEGRFYYGLGNIYPATKSDEFSASRNMTITATVGYNFRLK